jgi:hypothetical protein
MASCETPTFALVHGSWHDSWCMERLSAALADKGYPSIAIDLPLEDVGMNSDDHGLVIAQVLESQTNTIGVFHSFAGNPGPRGVNILNGTTSGKKIIDKMIFLNSGFNPNTLQALGLSEKEIASAPPKNSEQSRSARLNYYKDGAAMSAFDSSRATELLYHDVEKSLAIEAIKHLRPQYQPPSQPDLSAWPDIPQSYIICEDDKIVRPEWSEFVCYNWLRITPHYLPGSHSPFLSRPARLASMLIDIATEKQVRLETR